MKLEEALPLVYELACTSRLTPQEANTFDLCREVTKQQDALDTVHDFIVNKLSD